MKKIFRFLSAVLSAAFVFNLSAPAVAAFDTSENEIKSLTETIKDSISNFDTVVDISRYRLAVEDAADPASSEDYTILCDAINFVLDDPELFYSEVNKEVFKFAWDQDLNQYIFSAVEFGYSKVYDENEKSAIVNEFETKASEIIDSIITSDMDELDKIVKIHDYIALNTAYDTEGVIPDLNGGSSAYDVIVKNNGVCLGYARAYEYLLDKVGIESFVVKTLPKADGSGHAWNLVNLNDEWYHVDVTWDDPVPDKKGRVNHNYFMLSDQAMMTNNDVRTYIHDEWDSKGFEATNTKYDEASWAGVSTEIFIKGDNWYFIDKNGVYTTYNKSANYAYGNTGLNDQKWPVWGSSTMCWQGKYSSLIISGDVVYYNTPEHIYRMDLDGSNNTDLIYMNPQTYDGYIYGLVLEGDTLYARIKQNPKDDGNLVEAISLKLENYTFIDTLLKAISDMNNGDSTSFYMEDTEKIVPAQAYDIMKNKEIKVEFKLDDYSWDINSKNITASTSEVSDLNLVINQDNGAVPDELKEVVSEKVDTLELDFAQKGTFGLKANVKYNVGIQYKNNIARLYRYNVSEEKLSIADNVWVDSNGDIELSVDSGSSYIVAMYDMKNPQSLPDTIEKPPREDETSNNDSTAEDENNADVSVEVSEPATYEVGDVNMDGTIDLSDLVTLALITLGDLEVNEINIVVADISGDGIVNLLDVAKLKLRIS